MLTFREGRIFRYREFYEESQALAAVGLSQLDAHADS